MVFWDKFTLCKFEFFKFRTRKKVQIFLKIIQIKFGYIIFIRYLCIQKGDGKASQTKPKIYKP